ncbi:MerR family transcriptional regulator [Levilactobacillus mulengensis]|uniref:MerR family transcriptional regulator n=1 Tax=Levilactobacillus mulengensis TaxID=2486025 RepID=UPI0013DDAA7E|nr:MerR family transcriptional regulator [Levilactobacillus mulengensis]
MKINEAAKQLQTSAWTLRYYEQVGIMVPVARISGMRDYTAADIAQIKDILDLRDCGVTIEEIKQLQAEDSIAGQRQILTTQATELRAQIDQLQDSLERLEMKITRLPTQTLQVSGEV